MPMVWVFNVIGLLDLIYANISTFKDHVDPTSLGVSYYTTSLSSTCRPWWLFMCGSLPTCYHAVPPERSLEPRQLRRKDRPDEEWMGDRNRRIFRRRLGVRPRAFSSRVSGAGGGSANGSRL
jgi:hypothetical protein